MIAQIKTSVKNTVVQFKNKILNKNKYKMGTNLKEVLLDQGIYRDKIKTADFLIGKEVTVIKNTNGHNYGSKGTTFTVPATARIRRTAMSKAKEDGSGNNIRYRDLAIGSVTKEELKEQLEKLTHEYEKNREQIKQKILFLEETGEDKYDHQTFKVFSVLQTLKGKDSDMQKAKQIVKLIN